MSEANTESSANADPVFKSLRRFKIVPSFLLIEFSMFDMIENWYFSAAGDYSS